MMDHVDIEALFTRDSGDYVFARWARPIAPIVFGVEDQSLEVIKGALEAVAVMGGLQLAETDPELGSNLMFFFFKDWDELVDVPNMDKLVPGLEPMVAKLKGAQANQYRVFRFDEAGGIKACFVFLCMDEALAAVDAETLALSQVVQSVLLWSDVAFRTRSPLAVAGQTTVLRPEIGALIRAAYDPVMPVAAQDASHALRLAARIGAMQ